MGNPLEKFNDNIEVDNNKSTENPDESIIEGFRRLAKEKIVLANEKTSWEIEGLKWKTNPESNENERSVMVSLSEENKSTEEPTVLEKAKKEAEDLKQKVSDKWTWDFISEIFWKLTDKVKSLIKWITWIIPWLSWLIWLNKAKEAFSEAENMLKNADVDLAKNAIFEKIGSKPELSRLLTEEKRENISNKLSAEYLEKNLSTEDKLKLIKWDVSVLDEILKDVLKSSFTPEEIKEASFEIASNQTKEYLKKKLNIDISTDKEAQENVRKTVEKYVRSDVLVDAIDENKFFLVWDTIWLSAETLKNTAWFWLSLVWSGVIWVWDVAIAWAESAGDVVDFVFLWENWPINLISWIDISNLESWYETLSPAQKSLAIILFKWYATTLITWIWTLTATAAALALMWTDVATWWKLDYTSTRVTSMFDRSQTSIKRLDKILWILNNQDLSKEADVLKESYKALKESFQAVDSKNYKLAEDSLGKIKNLRQSSYTWLKWVISPQKIALYDTLKSIEEMAISNEKVLSNTNLIGVKSLEKLSILRRIKVSNIPWVWERAVLALSDSKELKLLSTSLKDLPGWIMKWVWAAWFIITVWWAVQAYNNETLWEYSASLVPILWPILLISDEFAYWENWQIKISDPTRLATWWAILLAQSWMFVRNVSVYWLWKWAVNSITWWVFDLFEAYKWWMSKIAMFRRAWISIPNAISEISKDLLKTKKLKSGFAIAWIWTLALSAYIFSSWSWMDELEDKWIVDKDWNVDKLKLASEFSNLEKNSKDNFVAILASQELQEKYWDSFEDIDIKWNEIHIKVKEWVKIDSTDLIFSIAKSTWWTNVLDWYNIIQETA